MDKEEYEILMRILRIANKVGKYELKSEEKEVVKRIVDKLETYKIGGGIGLNDGRYNNMVR